MRILQTMIRRDIQWKNTDTEPASVSVVIPTKDRADMVCRAIESVLSQTLTPNEIIVIDDHSTDNTIEKISKYNSLTIIPSPRSGVSNARNTGVLHAKSNWVAFLDSDDLWQKTKLEKQVSTIRDNPFTPIVHCHEKWLLNGRHLNQKKHHQKEGGDIFEKCLYRCMISPSGTMIHRDFFQKLGGFDPNYTACEDFELWLHITAKYSVAYIHEPLVIKHGGHPDQLSRKYLGMEMWRILAILELMQSKYLSKDQIQIATRVLTEKISNTKIGMIKHKRTQIIKLIATMEELQNSLKSNASTSNKNFERLSESLKLEMESIAVTA